MVISCLFKASFVTNKSDNEVKLLMIGIKNNYPQVISEWTSSSRNEIRREFRERFGEFGDKLRGAGYGAISMGPITYEAIEYFGQKLSCALFYKHTGKILRGKVLARFTNFHPNDKIFIENMLSYTSTTGDFKRGKFDLSDQFGYRFNADSQYGLFFGVVRFNEQSGFVIMTVDSKGWAKLKSELPERAADSDQIDDWLKEGQMSFASRSG